MDKQHQNLMVPGDVSLFIERVVARISRMPLFMSRDLLMTYLDPAEVV